MTSLSSLTSQIDDEPDDVLHRRLLASHTDGPPSAPKGEQTIDLCFPAAAGPVHVALTVDASPGCGGLAWPAGQVLARYLASTKASILAHSTVIDLGSGTGLVGLLAAHLGAHVWLTDQESVIPVLTSHPLIPFVRPLLRIMRQNVTLNHLSDRVHVLEYNWGGQKPTGLPSHTDFVLAADCVYFEPAFPLLVATLCDLADSNGHGNTDPEILFCYKKRRKADKRFFTLLKKHFEWKQVDDDPDAASYAREAIALLRLVRRRRPIQAAATKSTQT